MRRKLTVALTFLAVFAGLSTSAQPVDIPPEDQEIIELLEMLENVDLLKEELDMIKDMGAEGGDHAN